MDRINVGDLVLYHDQKAICTHKSNTVCHFRMMHSTTDPYGYAPVVLDSFFVGLYFDKGDLKIISSTLNKT